MVQTRKYYLKNHYLTLRSKVKFPGRSLWYTTHRLMVMHPYQISLTYLKRNNYLTLRSKVKVQQRLLWYATHHLMVMHPYTKYHWPISKETIIWPWGQRSRSKQRSLWYTTHFLWSCTHIPNIIDLSRKTKNVMFRTRKYYLKNHYLTFRSKVIMVCNTPPYGHAPTYQISLTYLERNHYLTSRGQRTRSHEDHYGTWHTALWSYTHIPNIIDLSQEKNVMARTRKYYLKNNYLTLRSKVKVPRMSLWYTTHRLMVMHPYQISLTYLKRNNYLTLRSKVKVQQRLLWYATHHLMVMHPYTKYHWPISKETIIWPWGQRSRSKQRSLWYTTHFLWSCTHIPNIIHLSRKTKKCYVPNKKILFKKPLFDLQVKGHYGMQHTTLWTCTHIPNIIDLSRKKPLFDLERSKDKVPRRSLRYVTHRLMVIHSHTKYHWPISREKCYGPDKKILFKNNYLTLRSKVKVPRMSLRYTTHRLMVMHPHIKYHWPI